MDGKTLPRVSNRYYARQDRLKETTLLDYLYGEDVKTLPPDDRLVEFGERIPKLSSPIANYLQEIWSFISSQKPQFSLANPMPAKETWLQEFANNCALEKSLYDVWERMSITGEVLLVLFPQDELFYKIRQFEYSEFIPIKNNVDIITGYYVQSVSGDSIYRLEIDAEKYRVFEKVSEYHTGPIAYTDYPHSYGEIPAILIANNRSLAGEGYPDFDQTCIDLAIELVKQTAIPATNFNYFGRPWIISPDPDATRKAIARKDVVLQAESSEDGGNPVAMSFNPVPGNHDAFIDRLKREFSDQMGITYVRDISGVSNSSSLALKTLFSSSIRTAEEKSAILFEAICKTYELALRMAARDGILIDVFLNQPDSYRVEVSLTGEPFPLSPAERLQNIQIVRSLAELGIDLPIALQEFYTKSVVDIEAMLTPNRDF
ncbi:MAG: hypothetical protein QW683_08605 [Candidatus Caldarchaeum sp.]